MVKCPKSDELEEALKDVKASKFLSVSMKGADLEKLARDDKYIYVNILPNTKEFGVCKNNGSRLRFEQALRCAG
ncbi:MAG: hypothetical protein LBR70_04115 [Lactobacillaceae bacterium]|nr:hypothetical protein [Lactobacillaceae bacterium]